MIKQREKGQSQLDYLWVNFGNGREILEAGSTTGNSNDIPSYGLVQELVDAIRNGAVGSVTKVDDNLIISDLDGNEINVINLKEFFSQNSTSVEDFGRRLILEEDIKKGSPYRKYQPVYYIKLDNGVEYVTPITNYQGKSNKLITTEVTGIEKTAINGTYIDYEIQSNLLFSNKIKGIVFHQEDDGLSGSIYLDGSTGGLKFSIMSQQDYDALENLVDNNTLYFIIGKPYMYFRTVKIGSSETLDLDDLRKRVTNIENLLIDWEENG